MTETVTFENVLSQYLYGELDMPESPGDRLRDWAGTPTVSQKSSLSIDAPSYMASVGRFAHLRDVSIVQDFFSNEVARPSSVD